MPGASLAVVESQGLVQAQDGASALTATLAIWKDAAELANAIANTEFVPSALRNKPAAVTAAMLTGAEVGLPPMASLAKIHVIEGRPGLSAEAMRALVLSRGHEIWADDDAYTTTRVKLYGRRAGSDKVSGVVWSMDDAKAAGLEAKQNWRKYPRAMLLARCTGELCRLMFADVLGGISYTTEEIDDGFDFEEPADDSEPAGPKTHTRKASTAKKAAAKRAAPQPAAQGSAPPLPPLPGEEDGSASSDEEPKGVQVKRAQQIAIKAQRAGLDDDQRHELISVVTNGRVRSGKDVTAEEGADVLQAVHEILERRKQLVDVEDATGDDPDDVHDDTPTNARPAGADSDPDQWNDEQWREFLRSRGVKVTEAIREAQKIAAEHNLAPPTSLAKFSVLGSACGLLVGFVEDLAEQRAGG